MPDEYLKGDEQVLTGDGGMPLEPPWCYEEALRKPFPRLRMEGPQNLDLRRDPRPAQEKKKPNDPPLNPDGPHQGWLPENRTSVVLDGRSRMTLREKDTCDEHERRGTLFFLVQRTHEVKDVNMALQPVSACINVDLNIPLQKKKRKLSWDSSATPNVPLLVNMKVVKKHTQLKMLDLTEEKSPGKKNQKKEEKKEEKPQIDIS